MAERLELDKAIGSEARWTSFLPRDPSPERLTSLVAVLLAHPDPCAPARAAHVLLALKRPLDALALLEGHTDRMSVAQRALVLCKLGEDDLTPERYVQVVGIKPHFGEVHDLTDVAAQMRLDYALGMAHIQLGNAALGQEHMLYANHLALIVGNVHMAPAVSAYSASSDRVREPRETLARQLGVVQEAARLGNRLQVERSARIARDVLIRLSAYHEIPDLVRQLPEWLDVSWWSTAARAMSCPDEAATDLPVYSDDPLSFCAAAQVLSIRAARAREAGQPKEAARWAKELLALPAWRTVDDLPVLSVAYRVCRILAHLYLNEWFQATRALSELAQDNLGNHSGLSAFYAGLTLAQMLSMGATYPVGLSPEAVIRNAVAGLNSVSPDLRERAIARSVAGAPTGLAVLGMDPAAPADLTAALQSRTARLSARGLMVRGRLVSVYPTAGYQVYKDRLAGRKLDSNQRSYLRRHATALAHLDLRLILEDDVERACLSLRRNVPDPAVGNRLDAMTIRTPARPLTLTRELS